jgi:hypothetical protein
MKLSELDDSDKIVTKDYLDMKLTTEFAKLRLEIEQRLNDQFRWSVGLILGLYIAIAIGYFIK